MANYNLVVNSKFNPFSFERYIQPYQLYEQAYKEVENAFAELDTKASVWEKMANSQTDKDAYEMYKTYSNDLRNKADLLVKHGLSAANKRDLLNMRARYAQEIVPIEQAYNTRQQHIKEQRDAYLKNPTLLLSRDASSTSLNDYIKNPQLSYETQSGALITKRVADAVSNYKNILLRQGNWKSTALGQLLEQRLQTGLSRQDIINIINNKEVFPEIQKLLTDVVDTSVGGDAWDTKNKEKAYEYALEGLYAGLGKETVDTQKNADYLNAYEQWEWEQKKKEATTPKEEPSPTEGIYFPNVEIGVSSSDYNEYDTSKLKKDRYGNITSSDIENIQTKLSNLDNDIRVMSQEEYTKLKNSRFKNDKQFNTLEKNVVDLYSKFNGTTNTKERNKLRNQIDEAEFRLFNYVDNRLGNQKNLFDRKLIHKQRTAFRSKLTEQQELLENYKNKYSHLDKDTIAAIKKGIALENQQSLQSHKGNIVNFGEDDNAVKGILNTVLSTSRTGTTTGIYKVDEDGKPTHKMVDIEDLPEKADDLSYMMTDEGYMFSDKKGNKYLIKNDDYTRNVANEVTSIKKHLTDFSKEALSKKLLKLEGNIVQNGRMYNEKDFIKKITQLDSELVTKTDNTIEVTLQQEDGDFIKAVVYDAYSKNPKIVYSSLNDIVENKSSGFSNQMNKYRSIRGSESRGTYMNRKSSATMDKETVYTHGNNG